MANDTLGASLNPKDFATGGGLMDDVTVTWKKVRFALWDYGGAVAPRLALAIDMETDDGNSFTQYYSAGDTKHFIPSADGKKAVPVGDKTRISGSTNMSQLMESLVNAGFPTAKLSDDASVLDGLQVHMNRQLQPKRANLPVQKEGKDNSVLVVTRVIRYPWDGQVNGTQASSNGVYQKAVTLVSDLILAKGSIKASSLPQEAFKALMKDKDRNEVVQLVAKAEFLGAAGQPWAFDGATVMSL